MDTEIDYSQITLFKEIFILVENTTFEKYNNLSAAQALWFLITFNLVALYVNALIFEVDNVKFSIQKSQNDLTTSNNSLRSVNEQISILNQQLLTNESIQGKELTEELRGQIGTSLEQLEKHLILLEQSKAELEIEEFHKVHLFIRYISNSIDDIIHWLYPKILREKSLIDAFRSDYFKEKLRLANIKYICIVDGFNQKNGAFFDLEQQGNQPESTFNYWDENTASVLFRVVQEAVSNAVKHSQAEHFILNLTLLSKEIVLYISDDGVGFDNAEQKQGFGLSGMANRVKTIGATFHIESYNGTKITVRIPI